MKLRQRVVEAAYRQFGRPTGLLGSAAGLLMAHRSSNRKRNEWAVSLLGVRPDDRVLELGCGPGLAIRELSRIARAGYVCAIDHSEVMLRQARRRNADGLRRGNVDLRLGSVDELPAFDAPFDKILAVNTVLFWAQPDAQFAQLRQMLRSGGLIAVVHQPRGPGATDESAAAAGGAIAVALERAGFSPVRLERLGLSPAVVCVIGVNGGTRDGGSRLPAWAMPGCGHSVGRSAPRRTVRSSWTRHLPGRRDAAGLHAVHSAAAHASSGLADRAGRDD